MKGFKKVLTGILAATMIMGASLNVSAAAGKISVNHAEEGTKYNFYRVFDLKGTGDNGSGEYTSVSYTINKDWTAFFNGDGKAYIVDKNTEDGKLNPINVDGVTKYINITEANVVEFTNTATKYATVSDKTVEASFTADATDAANGTDVEVNELGYYIMVPENVADQNTFSSGSIASITSTAPNAIVNVKASKPQIEKTDDVISAEIGQTVTYTLTGKVPNTASYEDYKYILSDRMDEGLTFNKESVKVYIDNAEIADAAIATTDENNKDLNGFDADIPVMKYQAKIGTEIKITYTATVNEKAVEKPQQKNKVTLKYGRNPFETTESKEEELYSSNVVISKQNNSGVKLENAKFALVKKAENAGETNKFYFYNDTTKKVEWVDVADVTIADETTSVTDEMAKKIADATTITKVSTDKNGAATFKGLKDGTYYLVEFEAPTGYNRLANPQKVSVVGKDADAKTPELENVAQAGQTEFDSQYVGEEKVINESGVTLPSTGGIGTTIFYIIGGLLIVAAVVFFVVRRRGDAE